MKPPTAQNFAFRTVALKDKWSNNSTIYGEEKIVKSVEVVVK
nr:hypothetical protein [uncultured Pedobacter sp.]